MRPIDRCGLFDAVRISRDKRATIDNNSMACTASMSADHIQETVSSLRLVICPENLSLSCCVRAGPVLMLSLTSEAYK